MQYGEVEGIYRKSTYCIVCFMDAASAQSTMERGNAAGRSDSTKILALGENRNDTLPQL